MKLTPLLNQIKPVDTAISDPLQALLDGLADGTYKAGKKGSLTITTVAPVVDEITGTWTADSSQLQTLDWFTGQETASQSLIDKVTAAKDITAWFAYDTDETTTTTTTTIPGSATSVTGAYYLQSGLTTTAWYGKPADAEAAAADLQQTGLAFVISGSNAGVIYKAWDGTQVRAYSVASSFTGPWAKTYTPSSTSISSTTITTVDALRWDGTAVVGGTFQVTDQVSWAIGYTDGYRTAEWDTNKRKVEGMTLIGQDGLQLQIV